jgi:hypothetical protein
MLSVIKFLCMWQPLRGERTENARVVGSELGRLL